MKKTTVAHMMIEKLNQSGINLVFPDHVAGDLNKEHDWAMSTTGFDLINNFRDVFDDVCNEVDAQVESGLIIFTDDGEIITK